MSQKSITREEATFLMGKLVRIWRSKKRDVGETVEGVIDRADGYCVSFPAADGRGAWVVTATRVLDVLVEGEWKPYYPRAT